MFLPVFSISSVAKRFSGLSLLITKESTSTQNGKNIYRKGAKCAKDVNNKWDFALLQGFLSDLRAFAVPSSAPACPG
jgi:hypothetical protein